MEEFINNDGITHINIYSQGKTKLGKMLSNFYESDFVHPKYGKFKTVEGLWYWLRTGKAHIEFRGMSGFKCKEFGRTKKNNSDFIIDERFKKDILIAIEIKINSNTELLKLFKSSKLPFEHYYVNNNVIKKLPQYNWIVEGIEKIRKKMNILSF